jgi:sulfur-carrier protein
MTVLFFGQCREIVGAGRAAVEVATPTAAGVVEAARVKFPGLGALDGKLLIAVNEAYAGPDTPVAAGDDIAIFPPVSGG